LSRGSVGGRVQGELVSVEVEMLSGVAVNVFERHVVLEEGSHRVGKSMPRNGLVLFNRFLQPDIDPETLTPVRVVSLSTTAEVRLPLTWIALPRGQVGASLAATTGVESSTDVIKYLLAGADVVMTASALLRHGPEHAAVLLDGLCEWMGRKGYATVEELRGLLAIPVGVDETARDRGDYVSALRQINSTDYAP
jgi:dihydroorotate dehydrogenase (fumarate)